MPITGYKTKVKKSQYTSYQRRAAINPNPRPYTVMSAYDVSTYEFASQPASSVVTSRESYTGQWRTVSGEIDRTGLDIGRFDVNYPFIYSPLGVDFASEVSDDAMRAVFGKTRHRKDSGLNAAVALAELNQTVGMFASTAIRLNRSLRALRRGDLKEMWAALGMGYAPQAKGDRSIRYVPKNVRVDDRTVSGRASNLLLEVNYGWRPLVSDLDAAAHKLATATIKRPPVQSIHGAKSMTVDDRFVTPSGGTFFRTRELSVAHHLQYRVSSAFIAHASSLGFTNPFLLAHEVIPLSFVLDWFIQIGEWLQGFSTFHGLEFVQGCTTAKGFTRELVTYPGSSETVDGVIFESSPGVFENHVRRISNVTGSAVQHKSSGLRRTVWTEFPSIPPPTMRMPKGMKQVAILTALLRQRRSDLGPYDKLLA